MMNKKTMVLAAGALVLMGSIFACRLIGVDDYFYSLHYLWPSAPRSDSVVIVGIDAKSIGQLGAWPWPRSVIAALIDRIDAAGARVVAVDLLFPPKPADSLGNDSLARVFKRMRGLVLPFKIEFDSSDMASAAAPAEVYRLRFNVPEAKRLGDGGFFRGSGIAMPDTVFAHYADYGGFLNVSPLKTSQKTREVIHVMMIGDNYYPSFGLAAAAAFLGVAQNQMRLDAGPAVALGSRRIGLTDYAGSSFVNFRGRAGTVATISAASVISGAVDLSQLRNRLVFVGVTEQGVVADFLLTPVGSQYPGVEMWATAAMDIIMGTWVRFGGGPLSLINLLLVLAIFPGLALAVPRKRRLVAIAGGGAAVVASIAAGLILFKTSYYFWNPTGHALAWVFSLLWLAAQKVDPTLAGPAAIAYESHDGGLDIALAPPTAEQCRGPAPGSECGEYVAGRIRAESPMISEQELTQRLCSLCNGRIVRLLGSGGMAEVFLVWNPRLEVYRAVKVLKPSQPQRILTRFETEIRICANLSHANIVQSFGVGDWYGLPYLEMEFINGASMEAVLPGLGKMLPEEVAAIGVLVCRALQYAHSREMTIYGVSYHGVIHRDLKPANIMISKGARVKLTDFGIARPTEVSLHTVDRGTIIGTLPYLAPEQAQEGKAITARADLYALGVTLYELLTGERAFAQQELTALLSAKALGKVKPLSACSGVPPALAAVISKAMAHDPAARYANAALMGADLEKAYCQSTRKEGYRVLQEMTNRIWSSPT